MKKISLFFLQRTGVRCGVLARRPSPPKLAPNKPYLGLMLPILPVQRDQSYFDKEFKK